MALKDKLIQKHKARAEAAEARVVEWTDSSRRWEIVAQVHYDERIAAEKELTHWIQQGYEFREEIDRLREALQAGYNHITTVGSMDDIQGAILKLMSEALATKPSEEATNDHD